ncbi:MAG: biopolymer transporter ExbD [Prevotella sp.]|jgi:biopolymer transport protein ExbD|nr:biopolymer transporter ExbD [Prevotella sp.]
MIFRRKRREVPGLNTTSTADISFMLLVFFLVTTSMDVDKGMNRQLPPKQDEKQEMMDVDRSKVMSLALSEEGLLTIDEKPANIDKIRRQLKEFIVSTGPSHIIELKTDRKCDYDTYFHLQNEIVRSYREIRDAASKQQFGKPYSKCSVEQREQLLEKYPQRVQEVY